MNIVYVTGNENKARLFNKMLGLELERAKVDVPEIQSLDPIEVVQHKVTAAYRILKRPVIVEDTFLTIHALGKLPGPFIKWFLEELKLEGLCRLLDGKDRNAVAGAVIAYYDGKRLELFKRSLKGAISDNPRGDSGFGWNGVFIPEGSKKTLGEMDEDEFKKFYMRIKPFDEVATFLKNIDKA